MNKYHILFSTSGDVTVRANDLNEAFSKIHKRFAKVLGSNQSRMKCVKINGELVEDERK